MNRTVLAIGLILAGATSASAQGWWGYGNTSGREVDARQNIQQHRIQQGVARRLADPPRGRRPCRRSSAGSPSTSVAPSPTAASIPASAQHSNNMQDSANRHIAQERSDRETRQSNGWWRRWW